MVTRGLTFIALATPSDDYFRQSKHRGNPIAVPAKVWAMTPVAMLMLLRDFVLILVDHFMKQNVFDISNQSRRWPGVDYIFCSSKHDTFGDGDL